MVSPIPGTGNRLLGAVNSMMIEIAIYAGIGLAVLLILGLIITRLYRRATKEIAFVRTGFRGERVIMNGGALVLPVLHETMPVNMNTVRLAVERKNVDALITLDRLRIDVKAEFYVRVRPDAGAIAMAPRGAFRPGQSGGSPRPRRRIVPGAPQARTFAWSATPITSTTCSSRPASHHCGTTWRIASEHRQAAATTAFQPREASVASTNQPVAPSAASSAIVANGTGSPPPGRG